MIDRPIDQMLRKASKRTSLHMPGMQGKCPFEPIDPYALDTTEIPETDDLYAPTSAIKEAQEHLAKSAGSAHSLLLTGGSTAGMHTMIRYALHRDDTLILPRNVHISAMHACANFGIKVHFAKPSMEAGLVHTTLASYQQAMNDCPTAKAILIVRPDYYGRMSDASEMISLCHQAHQNGMLVLVDEAHGAHLNWCDEIQTALACEADLCTQSAHKTLPVFTGGAWLHAREGIDIDRLRRMLRMVQTSSPSFLTMLSLDDARAWMDAYGREAIRLLTKSIEETAKICHALGYDRLICADPLRLVLKAPQGGFALMDQLSGHGIDVEMGDEDRIVCIVSLLEGEKSLQTLTEALKGIPPIKRNRQADPLLPPMPNRRLSLATATFACSEPIPLSEAVGRISAGSVGLYPPGIALLTAGEEITQAMVDWLQTIPPARLFGQTGNTLNCVKENTHE